MPLMLFCAGALLGILIFYVTAYQKTEQTTALSPRTSIGTFQTSRHSNYLFAVELAKSTLQSELTSMIANIPSSVAHPHQIEAMQKDGVVTYRLSITDIPTMRQAWRTKALLNKNNFHAKVYRRLTLNEHD
tara:strand:+ start:1335 stop:1727 length:393 start_codon:yes stop_codon:yes gene_type:complete